MLTNKPYRGIKGPCLLSRLKYYDPLESTNIDYMHSILYGVVHYLLNMWFCSDFSQERFSMIRYSDEKNKRLLSIRPSKAVPYAPRSIDKYHLWKAHELQSFILFYSLISFNGILEIEYYENFILLVISMEILLSKEITFQMLEFLQCIIVKFVKQCSMLYPSQIMLSGMHELLHVVKCTYDFGPMNSLSCFQFEEMNRKLKNLIKSKNLVGDEFIKLFSILQALGSFVNSIDFSNEDLLKFVTKHSQVKTSNKKYFESKEHKIKIGRKKHLKFRNYTSN